MKRFALLNAVMTPTHPKQTSHTWRHFGDFLSTKHNKGMEFLVKKNI